MGLADELAQSQPDPAGKKDVNEMKGLRAEIKDETVNRPENP